MTVVADSSPLVILAKLGCFDLLNRLFPRLYISSEVHHEVVVSGAGLPGASEVAKAEWIEVKQLQNRADLLPAQEKYALGVGELSTILLGKEIQRMPCCSMITMPANWQGRKASKFAAVWVSSKRFTWEAT